MIAVDSAKGQFLSKVEDNASLHTHFERTFSTQVFEHVFDFVRGLIWWDKSDTRSWPGGRSYLHHLEYPDFKSLAFDLLLVLSMLISLRCHGRGLGFEGFGLQGFCAGHPWGAGCRIGDLPRIGC